MHTKLEKFIHRHIITLREFMALFVAVSVAFWVLVGFIVTYIFVHVIFG